MNTGDFKKTRPQAKVNSEFFREGTFMSLCHLFCHAWGPGSLFYSFMKRISGVFLFYNS